jgi:hypothetical protein
MPMVANAQQDPATDKVAQANNPLANFTAFVLQEYYIGELTEPAHEANLFWIRFAKPVPVGFGVGQVNPHETTTLICTSSRRCRSPTTARDGRGGSSSQT